MRLISLIGAVVAALTMFPEGGLPRPAQAQQVVQRIAAVVNDEIISNRDLASRVGLAILASGLPDGADTRTRIEPQVLRGLIDERLQLQAAQRLRLPVGDGEIDNAFNDVAQRNRMTADQLGQFLQQRGVDPGVVRDQLRAQIAWLKVVNRELSSRVVVTNEQVELALKANRAADEEVLLSEILLPVYENGDEQAVLTQAGNIATEIRRGGSFAALAQQLSAAASAESGGDLGWIRLSTVAPELRPVIASLQRGQISQPIRTPAGVQLIEMRDRRPVAAQPLADDGASEREAVRQQLRDEQLQRMAQRYLRDLRRNAFIDVRL